tara:strand:- start:258 stop:641 length:384 start_codon:yes stop_codon:yes gene_type:complete
MVAMLGSEILNAAISISVYFVVDFITVFDMNKLLGIKIEKLISKKTILEIAQLSQEILPSVAKKTLLIVGGFAFLGLGLPPVTNWEGTDIININMINGVWWTALFPGLTMYLLCIAISIFETHHSHR